MKTVWCALLLVGIAVRCSQGALEPMIHQCINDKVQSAVGEMMHLTNDKPITGSSAEGTGKKAKKGKKHKRNASNLKNMRLHSVLDSSASDKSFFTSSTGAYQKAVTLFSNAFNLVRKSSKLTVEPRCSSTFTSGTNEGKCKKLDNNPLKCGPFTVPNQLIGAGIECKKKTGSCKQKKPSGAGVEADFIMFAGALDNECAKYGGSVLAYAALCGVDDDHQRPAIGYINVCYKNLLKSVDSLTDDIVFNILLHEMAHAFGFTSTAMRTLFRDDRGQLYNPVKQFSFNGKTIPGITSPKVLAYARQYYSCPTLKYVPLEDGGGSGSASSHWEARVLHHEMMMAFLSADYMVLSNFTWAYFEDSGWYSINYAYTNSIKALEMKWGKGLGCDFLVKPCTDTKAFPYSCTAHGCSFDHISKGVCDSWSQFFDGCKVTLPYNGGSCLSGKSAGGAVSEIFGENSRCYEHRQGKDSKATPLLACLNTTIQYHQSSGVTAYKIHSSKNSAVCEEGKQKVIDNRYVHCPPIKDITIQSIEATTISASPKQVCHSNCLECKKPNDHQQCTKCKTGLKLDGPVPNSCCNPLITGDCKNSESTSHKPSHQNSDIRLVNGSNEREGHVQMYSNGVWGGVCHNKWQTAEAIVVCKQLGFPMIGARSSCCSKFNKDPTQIPFMMDRLKCTGSEAKLSDCRHDNARIDQCSFTTRAGVYCPKPCIEGETRLIGFNGGQRSTDGRAAICHKSRFKPVCNSNSWNANTGGLFCKSLGFSEHGFILTHSNHILSGLASDGFVAISNCNGKNGVKECSINSATSCSKTVAGIACQSADVIDSGCIHGNVRLIGGSNTKEGRLEICMNRVWGTVCGYLWDSTDARVTCRQLGYSNGVEVSNSVLPFGPAGDGIPTFLNFVRCSGSESKLINCSNYYYTYCPEPATVRCT